MLRLQLFLGWRMSLGVEVFKGTQERLKMPIISTFVTSWLAWNWEAVFLAAYLLSADGYTLGEFYTFLDGRYSGWCWWLLFIFIFPLLSAAFLTFVTPHINTIFVKATEKTRREELNSLLDDPIEGSTHYDLIKENAYLTQKITALSKKDANVSSEAASLAKNLAEFYDEMKALDKGSLDNRVRTLRDMAGKLSSMAGEH